MGLITTLEIMMIQISVRIQAPSVGIGQGHIDAISLIQSNFGTPGNLEVVARIGDQLSFYFRY